MPRGEFPPPILEVDWAPEGVFGFCFVAYSARRPTTARSSISFTRTRSRARSGSNIAKLSFAKLLDNNEKEKSLGLGAEVGGALA